MSPRELRARVIEEVLLAPRANLVDHGGDRYTVSAPWRATLAPDLEITLPSVRPAPFGWGRFSPGPDRGRYQDAATGRSGPLDELLPALDRMKKKK